MAPSQAAAAEVPFREVLEAVGGFLVGCGLPRTAALLKQEAPLAEPTADVLQLEAKRLAGTLGCVAMQADAKGKENVEPSRACEEALLDELLAKALASGVICEMVGPNLAQTLERTLKETAPATGQSGSTTLPPQATTDSSNTAEGTTSEAVKAENQPSSAVPAPMPSAQPREPSQHYDSTRPAPPLSDGFADEYRDDGDPGYRVLAISEVELLAELQETYRLVLAEVQERARAAQEVGAAGQPVPAEAPAENQPAGALPEADELAAAVVSPDESQNSDANAKSSKPSAAGVGELGTERADAAAPPAPGAKLADEGASATTTTAAIPQADVSMSVAAQNAMLLAQAQQWQVQLMQAQPQPESMVIPQVVASRRKAKKRKNQPVYRYAPSGDDFYPAEMEGVVFDSFNLRVVFERDRTGFEESKEFPIQQGSIIAARYQVLNYLGSAAFSRAVHCLDLQRNEMVCMKIIKNEKDFVDQSLDEIKLLKLIGANCKDIDQKHCVRLIDYFYHKEHLIIVTELLRENLYEFSKWNREHGEAPYFTLGRLQVVSRQLLIALEYIHSLWLIHSDLKPENILMQSYSRCLVKLIDFGSSCFVDDHLSSYVQSRSYRAPEVLLGCPYGQKIDIWSLGCVIAELWTGYVLFQNDSVQSLLARIAGIVGPFPASMLAVGRFVPNYFTQDGRLFKELEVEVPPGVDIGPPELIRRIQLLLPKRSSIRQRMRVEDDCFEDFLTCLLQIDPAKRPTAAEAMQHPWLQPGRYSDGL